MNFLKTISPFLFLGLLYSCSDEISELKDSKQESVLLKKTVSHWNENDLYQVKSYQINNFKQVESNIPFKLKEGLLIEEITNEDYLNEKNKKYSHYLKDTLKLVKIDNSIKINKTILKDNFSANGNYQFYSYLGYFPIVNQYLIRGEYLDSLDYKMVDKNSGEIKQSFLSYPIISKNGNFVAICKTNEIEKLSYFEIYSYSNGFYNNAFKGVFTNWRIVDFEDFAFFGINGSFYLKVQKMNEGLNSTATYLRITLN